VHLLIPLGKQHQSPGASCSIATTMTDDRAEVRGGGGPATKGQR